MRGSRRLPNFARAARIERIEIPSPLPKATRAVDHDRARQVHVERIEERLRARILAMQALRLEAPLAAGGEPPAWRRSRVERVEGPAALPT